MKEEAIEWFNSLMFEDKTGAIKYSKEHVPNVKGRHPDSLTGREIEQIYNYHVMKNKVLLDGSHL